MQINAANFWAKRIFFTCIHCYLFFNFTGPTLKFINDANNKNTPKNQVVSIVHGLYLVPTSGLYYYFETNSYTLLYTLFFINIFLLSYIDLYKIIDAGLDKKVKVKEIRYDMSYYRHKDGTMELKEGDKEFINDLPATQQDCMLAINKKMIEFVLTAQIKSWNID